ncbi:MAG: group 1 truncated hemoglobin [Massilia sp.]
MTLHTLIKRASLMLAMATAFFCAVPAQAADDTLYQQLGGQPGIDKIVAEFVPIILADERINSFFKKTDMKKLSVLLGEQFCQLAGGPCTYSGRDMVAAHDEMGVKSAHFNALAEDLQIAMEHSKIATSASNQLIAKLAPMQRAVVR